MDIFFKYRPVFSAFMRKALKPPRLESHFASWLRRDKKAGKATTTGKQLFSWVLLTLGVAMVLAAFVGVPAGLLAILFAATGWWVWQNPREAVLFFIVLAPILPMLKFTQAGGAITLLKDVIILTLFIRLVAWPLVTKTLAYRYNPLVSPLIALGTWVILGMLRADNVLLGVLRARDIILYVLLYLAVVQLPLTRSYIRSIMRWAGASLAVVLMLGVYQWFGAGDSAVLRFDPERLIWIPRISSVFAHPSVFGEYLLAAVAWLTAGWLVIKRQQIRIAFFIASIGLLPFIFLTYSRGVWIGYVATMATIAVAYVFSRSGRDFKRIFSGATMRSLGIGLLIIAATSYMFTPVGTFIRSSLDPTYASNAERLEFAARLIAPLSTTDALIGVGLGDVTAQNFRSVSVTTAAIAAGDARDVQLAKNATLVDSQHLKTFVELGFFGLLIYAWVYTQAVKASWQAALQDKVPIKILGLTTLGFIASFIIQGFFIDTWDIFPTNAIFWILAGLTIASQTKMVHDQL